MFISQGIGYVFCGLVDCIYIFTIYVNALIRGISD